MAYTKPQTLDASPSGDTVKTAIVSKVDVNATQIVADLNTHEALTATHGATGAIVGTTNTQTLTNKTLTSPTISWLPAGTKMVFYQDVAPTGWTIANTLDDKVLFVTKGSAAGGQLGGGAHSTGTWTQPTHVHAGGSHTHSFTGVNHTHLVSDHTLTTSEIPSHHHGYGLFHTNIAFSAGTESGVRYGDPSIETLISYTHASGGGSAHNHGYTGDADRSLAGATGASGTTDTGASATPNTWRPAAYCAIIATKD